MSWIKRDFLGLAIIPLEFLIGNLLTKIPIIHNTGCIRIEKGKFYAYRMKRTEGLIRVVDPYGGEILISLEEFTYLFGG